MESRDLLCQKNSRFFPPNPLACSNLLACYRQNYTTLLKPMCITCSHMLRRRFCSTLLLNSFVNSESVLWRITEISGILRIYFCYSKSHSLWWQIMQKSSLWTCISEFHVVSCPVSRCIQSLARSDFLLLVVWFTNRSVPLLLIACGLETLLHFVIVLLYCLIVLLCRPCVVCKWNDDVPQQSATDCVSVELYSAGARELEAPSPRRPEAPPHGASKRPSTHPPPWPLPGPHSCIWAPNTTLRPRV